MTKQTSTHTNLWAISRCSFLEDFRDKVNESSQNSRRQETSSPRRQLLRANASISVPPNFSETVTVGGVAAVDTFCMVANGDGDCDGDGDGDGDGEWGWQWRWR